MQEELESVKTLVDAAIAFIVAYGFQILGAVIVLVIGLKIAGWAAGKTVAFGDKRDFDPTLTRFAGNVVRILLIAVVLIVTLSNFGITIAPFVAIAGAAVFGGTLAIQGPLSNYGAGLSIILSRPFRVGDTVEMRGVHGVVDEITLAATVLTGEDGEQITVPNKEVVGQIIVNSHGLRVVETTIVIASDGDAEAAIAALKAALTALPATEGAPAPQVGIHDFTYGGIVLGARFWVPSLAYFQTRYEVNRTLRAALAESGVALLPAAAPAVLAATPPTAPGREIG